MAFGVLGTVTLLQVFDMRRSVAFYRDMLGFAVIRTSQDGEDFDWALLRLDGAELMLNTMYEKENRPSADDPARAAAHADTTLFYECRDLDAVYRHFRAKGIDLAAPVVREYGMRQLSLQDPDGYGLCFQSPA